MLLALPFPDIDPALFTISLFGVEFALRWYALAYVAGLVLGWRYVVRLLKRPGLWPAGKAPMAPKEAEDLLTWMVLGVVLGGRIGYIVFYQPEILATPARVLAVWEGGMSFHGGFLGVVAGIIVYSLLKRKNMLSLGDAVAAATPIGLFFGRLANFINGELWGRPTTLPWGVVFPDTRAQLCPERFGDPCARHPSQLYEAALEGLLLFVFLFIGVRFLGWLKHPGRAIGVFLLGYGLARTFVEGVRQGDMQFVSDENPWGQIIRLGAGPEAWGLTMGQILSLPMAVVGLAILFATRRSK
ncbi:prolipoprotein diacylglyceryl transferase [Algicella marina]|uniref:Phosphatidylglycerol--prolipoprotein diacylglyceryl transferase n=1 Tax=Algicella marina TaxID=2683284 RepID=A0A6P1SW43_9RHOB|nr:prolipoprotein diacylglyceryl transferase [Algicella marina]QHQ33711.1 prolipoprotein diacylglyceryl transferase [Algicella marina]